MQLYWSKDQTDEGQFDIYYSEPGKQNLADYQHPTEHHTGTPHHALLVRPIYLCDAHKTPKTVKRAC